MTVCNEIEIGFRCRRSLDDDDDGSKLRSLVVVDGDDDVFCSFQGN